MKKIIAILTISAIGISSTAYAGNPSMALVDPEVENKVPLVLGASGLGIAGTIGLAVVGLGVLGAIVNDDSAGTTTSSGDSN